MNKTRHQFIEEMFENVNALPIEQIVGQYVALVPRGIHYMGLCPFHADTHIGSFVVTPSKGIWKCFACGDEYSGNGIRFVSLLHNISYLDAAFSIALDNRIITQEEYDFYRRKRFSREYISNLEMRYSEKKVPAERPVRANADVIDIVYRTLKECCPLSEAHFLYLREKRQISEERISADYFSFPSQWKQKDSIVQKIKEQTGYSDDILKTVPGFFIDKKRNKLSFSSSRGIGILIHDADGMVRGIQIRHDEIKEGRPRYTWFSSVFAWNDKENFDGGCGCGSPKDVIYPIDKQPKFLCITEGRFKSEVIAKQGNTAISVQGVSTWSGIDKTIRTIQKQGMYSKIFLSFDSDILGNHQLLRQLSQMADSLKNEFPDMTIKVSIWKKVYGKGIDDCIFAGNVKKIHYFYPDELISKCNKAWRMVLDKYHVKSEKELALDDRKQFVNDLQEESEKILEI